MKKFAFIIIALLSFSDFVYSQDTIVRVGGEKVICKIAGEDYINVYYTIYTNGSELKTCIKKSDIETINYGKKKEVTPLSEATPLMIDRVSFGFGMGFDFGGYGASLIFYPHKNIGLFGGMGYAIAGVGYNAGVRFRYISDKTLPSVSPFVAAMYGYNAVIYIKNASYLNKFFYGSTLGLGIDYHANSRGYWSFAILLPIRGTEVKDYINDLKNNHSVKFENYLPPIGISIGYRFVTN